MSILPENETILSLDTSSKYGSISISKGEEILSEYNFNTDNKLSTILIPGIEFVLKTVNLDLEAITAFGLGIGPGSFTGIRVGLATLKGLLFGNKKPVIPVSSLEALAYKYHKTKSLLVPIIDAKRNEIYFAGYYFSADNIQEIIPPDLIRIEDIKAKLGGHSNFIFIGDGVNIYKDFLKENFKNSKLVFRSSFLASEICRIAYNRYLKKRFLTDIQEVKPFYIKKPDAEKTPQPKNKKSPGR
jgi:tRNA threonylcarbamoyladenosine biosynthesis protein TsaB